MEKRGRGEEGRRGEVKKDFRATGGAEGAGKRAQGTRIRAVTRQTSATSATKGQQEARAAEGGLFQVCVGSAPAAPGVIAHFREVYDQISKFPRRD